MKLDPIAEQPIIPATRLTLRPIQKSDTALMELYGGDERVARNTTSIPHPVPPGTVEALIERAHTPDRVEDIWVMDATDAGLPALVGVIALERMDRQQSEIGYWVAPAFWNTGLASEAVNAIVRANPQGAQNLYGSVFQDNPASARILTNAGFDYLGDAEAFCVARNATVATWTYSRKMI